MADKIPPRKKYEGTFDQDMPDASVYIIDVRAWTSERTLKKNCLYVTSDHSRFILDRRNREIRHNPGLERSLLQKGFLGSFPVVCKWDPKEQRLVVLDGQHRLFYAMKHGIDVCFIIDDGLSIEDAAGLNTTQKSWNILDYINQFEESGIDSYKRLREIREEYRVRGLLVRWTVLVMLLEDGYVNYTGANHSSDFKGGEFRIRFEEETREILDAVLSMQPKLGDTVGNRMFVAAMSVMYWQDIKPVTFEQVVHKLKNSKKNFQPDSSTKEGMLRMIQEAVNWYASKPLYFAEEFASQSQQVICSARLKKLSGTQ